MDLAKGHIAALRKLKEQCGCRVGRRGRSEGVEGGRVLDKWSPEGWLVHPPPWSLFSPGQIYNLGTGMGYSVLQMVRAMEKASGRKVGHPPGPALPDSQQTPPLTLAYLMGSGSAPPFLEGLVSSELGEAKAGQLSDDHPPLADPIQGGGTAGR